MYANKVRKSKIHYTTYRRTVCICTEREKEYTREKELLMIDNFLGVISLEQKY